jgi:hypothetical protein
MKNHPEFESAYKKQLLKNISEVRKSIGTKNMNEKITNHSKKFNRTEDDIINKILCDDMYAEIFAIDPQRQNVYEIEAAKYISEISNITDFINHPNSAKIFVVDGNVEEIRKDDIKSVDFTFKAKANTNFVFYVTHKYTGTGHGTTQKHQYSEIRKFLENCKDSKDPNNFFIAVLDGPYYERYNFIEELNVEFSTDNIRILRSNEIESFVNEVVLKKSR